MKLKLLFPLSILIVFTCSGLLASNISNSNFISFGNVDSQGLGSDAGYYNNVQQYWKDDNAPNSTKFSYTGYLMVGGRYMVQHQGIAAGWHGGSNIGTLDFIVTDTVTGLKASISQQTSQSFDTVVGAMWTVRENSLSGKTLYEFLMPWGSAIKGICYDFDSYFNFQNNSLSSVGNEVVYEQAGSNNGSILGLINIGNITNSNSNWENTDLVVVIINNPNEPKECFAYLLNYDSEMMGPVTLGGWIHEAKGIIRDNHSVNAISGNGTVDANGNFGALICISFNAKQATISPPIGYFIPVISSGEGIGNATKIDGGVSWTSGTHYLIRPVWTAPNNNTSAIQSWEFTADSLAYKGGYTSPLDSVNSSAKNMGYIIRSGDDILATNEFKDSYKSKTDSPSADSEDSTDLTNLLTVSLILGVPPGIYSQNNTSSSAKLSNTQDQSVGIANSYSNASNSNVGITIPSKYGSIGGTFALDNTNSSSQSITLDVTGSTEAKTSNTGTFCLFGASIDSYQNQVWFLGSNAGLYDVHYGGEQSPQGKAAFPVTVITEASTYYHTPTYDSLPVLLQGIEPPNNNISSQADWNAYYGKMTELQKWINGDCIRLLNKMNGDGIQQGASSGDTESLQLTLSSDVSTVNTIETAKTVGWKIDIGKELDFGHTSTTTFTTSTTLTQNNSASTSISYAGPTDNAEVKIPTDQYPTLKPCWIYIDVPKCKMSVMGATSVDNNKRPWFISNYMWDNNKSFFLLVYNIQPYPGSTSNLQWAFSAPLSNESQ